MSVNCNRESNPVNRQIAAHFPTVDAERLDLAMLAVRAHRREIEVVAAVRRVNGLQLDPITTEQIRANCRLLSRQSMWLGAKEALAHGFLVGEQRRGTAPVLAIAPEFAR